jgi:hypothetical protein
MNLASASRTHAPAETTTSHPTSEESPPSEDALAKVAARRRVEGAQIGASWDCRAVRTGHDDSVSVTLTLDGGGASAVLSGSFFSSEEALDQNSLVAQAVLANAVAIWALEMAQANQFEGHVGAHGETMVQVSGPVSTSRDLVLDIQVPEASSSEDAAKLASRALTTLAAALLQPGYDIDMVRNDEGIVLR